MMYQAYEKKVRLWKGYAHILKICIKCLVGLCILAAIMTLGYFSLRGIHFGSFEQRDVRVAFGEKPDFDVFVLLGTYKCEYAPIGSEEWSQDQPIVAGEYRVRAVITKGFFKKVYSEPGTVTLYRRQITLSPSQVAGKPVPYGEEAKFGKHWKINARSLAKGHKIKKASLISAQLDGSGGLAVWLDASSVVIEDRRGRDVTDCYIISSGGATLNVKKVQISITVAEELKGGRPVALSKEYDGTPLYTNNYFITKGEMKQGDHLSLTTPSPRVDAGKGSNAVNIEVYSPDGQNRTAYYKIQKTLCRVEITKRPIEVTTGNETLTYNGSKQYGTVYRISKGALVAGHNPTTNFAQSQGVTEATARPVKNKIAISIQSFGRDVTANYDITYHYGELTVQRRQLGLRTQTSQGLVYNGQKQSATGYSIESGSFAPGHSAAATSFATQIVPGSCENRVEYKIVDGAGKNVTENYDLTVSYGTLTVEKGASLLLSLQELTKTYDASALNPGDYSAKQLVNVIAGTLYPSDSIEIVSTTGTLTDVGTTTYTVRYRIVHKVSLGKTEDATSWYTDNGELSGTLSITPRTVTLTFDAINKHYDGKAAVPSAPNTKDTSIARFEGVGHKVVLAPDAMQHLVYSHGGGAPTDIGEYTYIIPEEYISVVKNDGSGADRTHNYQFVFKNNKISISGLTLTLTAPSASKKYDGTPLLADSFSPSQVRIDGDVKNYSVTFTLTGSQLNAGSSPVDCANVRITDRSGADVTKNFKIIVKQGKLTVTPLSITVKSSSGSKVYDGAPMDNATQMTLVSGNLLDGHVLGGAVNSNYITDVGTHKNDRVTPKVYSETGQDLSRNYDITLQAGTYTVNVCDLLIKSPAVQGEYCGAPWEGECDATAHAEGLGKGHVVKLQIRSAGELPGTYPMQVLGCTVKDARGRNVSDNYNITYTDGTVEIVPRKIEIVTGSSTVEYGKGAAVSSEFRVRGSGLVKGHEAFVTFAYPEGITEIGSIDNAVQSVRILDKNGNDVTDLYEISCQHGTLRVTPISITLATDSAEKEIYDGQPIAALGYQITKGELLAGHRITVTYEYPEGIADVGKWKNELALIRVTDRNGVDVTYLYDFKVNAGTLHIKKPFTVTLNTGSAEKIYDGTALEQSEYSLVTELIEGHAIVGVNTVKLVEAGEKGNKLTLTVHDALGRDVTKNYDFDYEELGTLTVTPRDLRVSIGHVELTYTGQVELLIYESKMTYDGLVAGERIRARVLVQTPDIGDKSDVEFLNLRVTTAGGRDITHCYNVTPDTSALSVTVVPANLVLYLPERFSKEYDGQGVDVYDVGYRPQGLATGHRVEFAANEIPAQPGTYTLSFGEWTVYDRDGNDVTGNYTVDAKSCSVNIYQRTVTLKSKSASRHYNGQPLFCHELENYKLPDGYSIEVHFTGEQTAIGKSQNLFDVRVFDAEGNDITEYCTLSLSFGTLEVWDQLELTISSGSALGIYNGEPLVCHQISDYKLPEGYWLDVIFTGEQTAPGESANTFYVIIYDPEGNDVTASFALTREYGKLRVLEKASDYILTLRSESASASYDGTPLTHHVLAPYTLPEGFVLDVEFTGVQTEIGQSANTFVARAYNERGDELTVVYEYGTLEVYLDLTVNAYEMTYIYDGTEKNCHDFWVQGLPEGVRVEVQFGAGLTVTGSKDVEFASVKVFDVNGNDITSLCRIRTKTAKLTVLPRTLTVYVYGQSADSIAPVQGTLVEGHTMFAEYGDGGECFIEITDASGTLVYSNRGDSPIKHVLYDVNILYG